VYEIGRTNKEGNQQVQGPIFGKKQQLGFRVSVGCLECLLRVFNHDRSLGVHKR
jgi:hypothetical protein